jgi:hypothetical protein
LISQGFLEDDLVRFAKGVLEKFHVSIEAFKFAD